MAALGQAKRQAREARQDARMRGAGVQLRGSDFGLDLGLADGPIASTAATQSTPDGATTTVASTRNTAGIKSSARQEITEVDENGSVVKKRRIAGPSASTETPVPNPRNAQEASVAGSSPESAKKSTAKRKKRKSIGQQSTRNKRLSKARTSAGIAEVADREPAVQDEPGLNGSVEDDAVVEAADDAPSAFDEVQDQVEEAETIAKRYRKRLAPAPVITETEPAWKRQAKSQRASKTAVRAQKAGKHPPKATVQEEDVITRAVSDGEDRDDGAAENLNESGDDAIAAEPPQSDDNDPPPTTDPVKRKKRKRKSVNPLQAERRKRASLEAARQPIEQVETEQEVLVQSARPQARKFASKKDAPASRKGVHREDEASQAQSRVDSSSVPTRTKKPAASPQKRAKISAAPAEASSSAPVKGSIPITVFRLQEAPNLHTIAEEDEEDPLPAASRNKGPNAVDALAQVTGEIVRARLTAAEETENEATGRAEISAARIQRSAIEAYGDSRSSNLIDMAQAADRHEYVHARLRQAKKTRKSLKAELIASRAEEDELKDRVYELQKRHELARKVAKDDEQIVTLYRRLGRAIRDARESQTESDDLTPSGLEYELRSGVSSAKGRQGLLQKIRALNAGLETIAT